MKKKRILITGGAGFLGSFLCEKLINEGNYVICCDNFYTGNKDNLVNILNNKNFELIRHDITFPKIRFQHIFFPHHNMLLDH